MLKRKQNLKPLLMVGFLLVLMIGLTGCIRGIITLDNISVTSPDFKDKETLDKIHSKNGGNISPELDWSKSAIPSGTKSFVVICDDQNVTNGFTHWIVYNIPLSVRHLEKGLPKDAVLANGAKQGKNSFGNIGYDGPEPPADVEHRYSFKVYAVNKMFSFDGDVTKETLKDELTKAALAEGHMLGFFTGPKPSEPEQP